MLDTPPKLEASDVPLLAALNQTILTTVKGGGIKFFGLLFAYAMRFALGIVMARFMGAEQYGLYSLADTASYLIIGLTMLGLFSALVRYIPIYVSRRDEAGLWGTLQIGLGVPFVISVLAGACLLIFAGPFAEWVFKEPRLSPVLRVVAVALPFGALITAAGAAVRGFNQIQYNVIAEDVFLSLIKLAIVVVLAISGLNAVKAMTAHAIGAVLTSLMLLYFLNKLFPLKRPWGAARRDVKEIAQFAGPIYGSTLVNLVGYNLHTVLLGMLNTVAAVGIFTAASRVSTVGTMFYQAISAVAMPIISELHSKRELVQLGHFYQVTTKWIFTFNLPLFLIVLLFSKFIMSIFGNDFVAGATGLVILSVGNLVDAGTGINGEMILMTGNAWLNTINTVIALTLQLTLSFLLIPMWGVMGAAIAVAVATSALNIIRTIEVFVTMRFLPYNKSFVKPVVAGVAAALATRGMAQWFLAKGDLISTGLNMGFLLITYAAMILMLGLSEEDQMVITRLRGRLTAILPGQ